MQTLKQDRGDQVGENTVFQSTIRFVPAPHTASEAAAMEAALSGPARKRHAVAARIMIGTAVVAMVAVLPDLSLGAIGKPETRVQMEEALDVLPQTVWTPTARSGQPVYAPVMASNDIALEAVTVSPRMIEPEFDALMPVAALEAGSERFDLAFAGGIAAVELPQTTLSASLPRQAPGHSGLPAPAVRTRLIDVPQIADLPPVRRVRPGLGVNATGSPDITPSEARAEAPARAAPVRVLTDPSSGSSVSDVSAGSDGVLATMPESSAGLDVVRAVPSTSPAPDVSADALREAALVPKAQLDARINGVLTGRVDFRQLDGTIALRLRSVIGILRDQFSNDEFEQLVSVTQADRFVTLAELQSVGLPISYNPAYDEIEFGIDYSDAPHADKVQVPQISQPTMADQDVMIEQITR